MDTISARVAAVIKASGLSKTVFAKRVGLSQPFVSQLANGNYTAPRKGNQDEQNRNHGKTDPGSWGKCTGITSVGTKSAGRSAS